MYYMTMVRGKRVAVLSGPYDCFEAAQGKVEESRLKALEIDAYHWFDSFGVTKFEAFKKSAFGQLT